MSSNSKNDVSAGHRQVMHDEPRLTRRFGARLPEIDVVRNSLTAHAAIGSRHEHGCSKERAQ
jgi:hypothetical protein